MDKPLKKEKNPETKSRKVLILDTSILLTDPESLLKFEEADIVLPLTVIEELDRQKARMDEIGRSARQVSRLIEKYRLLNGGKLDTPVSIGENSTLKVELNGLRLDKIRERGLDASKNDNRIIAAALGVQAEGRDVELISLDVNMRIKSSSLGVPSKDWTPVRDSIYGDEQVKVLEVNSKVIDELYKNHKILLSELDAIDDFIPSENLHYILKSNKQSALVRYIKGYLYQVDTNLTPWGLKSRNKEQDFAIDLLMDRNVPIVSLDGSAGTGKTILALASALEQTFEPSSIGYDRILILRPVVAVGRQDIGFLPGDVREKLGPWFESVLDTMVALGDKISHSDAKSRLEMWIENGKLDMESVTFLRGRSLQKTFIIVDEAQNLEGLVLKTILTRVGEGSKIVLLGDTSQIDNPYLGVESNAISILNSTFKNQTLFGHVTLTKGERSEVSSLAAKLLN